MRSFAALLLFFALASCDADSGDGVTTYRVQLDALNGSGASGLATIRVDSQSGVVFVDLDAGGLDDRLHAQHIHARVTELSECPTASADVNADGFIDVVEGLPSYGGILLPLDNDIGTQDQNVEGFPTGSAYTYSTAAPLADVRAALIRTDPDPDDAVVTLGPDGSLAFSDWAIVVHGTTDPLPETVATLPGLDRQTTLPVACGSITF